MSLERDTSLINLTKKYSLFTIYSELYQEKPKEEETTLANLVLPTNAVENLRPENDYEILKPQGNFELPQSDLMSVVKHPSAPPPNPNFFFHNKVLKYSQINFNVARTILLSMISP